MDLGILWKMWWGLVTWLIERMDKSAQDHHPSFSQLIISIWFSLSLRDSAWSIFMSSAWGFLPSFPVQSLCVGFCKLTPHLMYPCVFYKLRMAFGLLGFKPRLVIMTTELLLENYRELLVWNWVGGGTCWAGQLRNSEDKKELPHISISNESFSGHRAY